MNRWATELLTGFALAQEHSADEDTNADREIRERHNQDAESDLDEVDPTDLGEDDEDDDEDYDDLDDDDDLDEDEDDEVDEDPR